MADCKTCPLNSEYRFREHCRVSSCKFYSPQTSSRCMGLDIIFSSDDKGVSDAELLYYKFPDKDLTAKEVSKVRKRAVSNVRSCVALWKLIKEIEDRFSPEEGTLYFPQKHLSVDVVLQRKPLSVSLLSFRPWMLKFLVDKEFVSETLGPKFSMREALRLKNREYSDFVSLIKSY